MSGEDTESSQSGSGEGGGGGGGEGRERERRLRDEEIGKKLERGNTGKKEIAKDEEDKLEEEKEKAVTDKGQKLKETHLLGKENKKREREI